MRKRDFDQYDLHLNHSVVITRIEERTYGAVPVVQFDHIGETAEVLAFGVIYPKIELDVSDAILDEPVIRQTICKSVPLRKCRGNIPEDLFANICLRASKVSLRKICPDFMFHSPLVQSDR